MAIRKETWEKYIINNLFKSAEFMNYCKRADENVYSGAVVHIQQAGAKPIVVKNRSTLPATITRRADTDIVYVLDEYTSNPTNLTNAEKYEESPEKLASILMEHVETIRESVGDDILFSWLAGFAASGIGSSSSAIAPATLLRTTGALATTAATAPGATGNRRIFVKEDLAFARARMNKANVLKSERCALLSSDMLQQLMDDADLKKRDFAGELDMKNGVITRLYGFDILERSYTATYDTAGIIKPVGAAVATTDNDVAICWQKNAVELALGTVEMFEEIGKADYYGDVYSALVRAGGRKRFKDAQGVIAIVQASV